MDRKLTCLPNIQNMSQETIDSSTKSITETAKADLPSTKPVYKVADISQAAYGRKEIELAEAEMPIAVKKMTAKAAEDKIARDLERRELSERNMSAATRHFHELDAKKLAEIAQKERLEAERRRKEQEDEQIR